MRLIPTYLFETAAALPSRAFDKKAGELAAGSGKLEEIVAEMKKSLPARKQGEWLIGANLQIKYLKGTGGERN